MMNKRFLSLVLVFALLAAWMITAVLPAQASPDPQAYVFTPTAGPDGRILYRVQPGDTCIGVSLRMGVSIEQIQLLNNIRGDCSLIADTEILLGTVEVQPTSSGPTAEATALVPTTTPFAGFGEVCVRLFNDQDGNAQFEDDELGLAGGAVSLADRVGAVSLSGVTTADEAVCFRDLAEGEYSVSMGVPEGYNATTRTSYTLAVKAGDQSLLDFGAQISSAAVELPPSEGGRSPLMGLIGGVVLVLGAALGIYATFFLNKRSQGLP